MATVTYQPRTSSTNWNWNDPSVWSGGVVPNDPTADVVVPTTTLGTSQPFVTTITETGNISIRSLDIMKHNLTIQGALSISGRLSTTAIDANIGSAGGGFVNLSGGTLSAGSINNRGFMNGGGTVNVAGEFLNSGTLGGSNLTITAGSFTNTGAIGGSTYAAFNVNIATESFTNSGTVAATSATLTLTVAPGGFAMTGGQYLAGSTGRLNFNVGNLVEESSADITLYNTGAIYSSGDSGQTYVPLSSTLHRVGGSLSLMDGTFNWSDLNVDGTLTLSNSTLNSPELTVDGTLNVANSILNVQELAGHGQFNISNSILSLPELMLAGLSLSNATVNSPRLSIDGALGLSQSILNSPGLTLDGNLSLSGKLNSSGLTVDGSLDATDVLLTPSGLTVNGDLRLGSGTLTSPQWTINASGTLTGNGTAVGLVVNNGKIVARATDFFQIPDSPVISGPITGSGTIDLFGFVSLDSRFATVRLKEDVDASQTVIFHDRLGILVLDDPFDFHAKISPAGAGDRIVLPGVSLSSVTGYGYSGDTHAGTLAINTTAGEIDLDFLGSFATANFTLTAEGQGLRITNTGGFRAGASGDDNITLPFDGTWVLNGNGGNDTVTLPYNFFNSKISYVGNTVIIDPVSFDQGIANPPLPGRYILTGIEKFVFADGTIDNNDSNPLVDDLFYYAKYRDVWNAHVDPDQHYDQFGWREARDPNPFFSTTFYLSLNQDVKAAGINPLTHFDQAGWKEGRLPSASFELAKYLAANPDIAAAQIDPLAHFLQYGAGEGRQPIAATSLLSPDGFDAIYYLKNNPDVQTAEVDPHAHYLQIGWKEGRNPNAFFDDGGYLATYTDVKNAGINPLLHYHQFGWIEGRDPSKAFDTTSYLAAYPDVQAIHIDPLLHFLQFGMAEGRSAFGDNVWG